MNEEDRRLLRDAAHSRLQTELVPLLRRPMAEWTPDRLARWRNRALGLAHLLGVVDSALAEETRRIAELAGRLWRLVGEHQEALEEIEDYRRARRLDAGSFLVAWGEEYFSGEDTSFRELAVNAVSFLLGWASNTVWVEAGEKSHRAVVRSFLPEIQELLWDFFTATLPEGEASDRPERIDAVAERVDKLVDWIAQANLPTSAQVGLVALLLALLIRIRTGRLLTRLDASGGDDS